MAKKKIELVKVRVTGPNCKYGERVILPGETATVPAELAEEWKQSGRAVAEAAEVQNGNRTNGK